MSKFNKFLEEDNLAKKEIKTEEERKNKNYSSLKIKMDTLDTLRKVKIVTKEISYSSLIDKMIEIYIENLPKEERKNINTLI